MADWIRICKGCRATSTDPLEGAGPDEPDAVPQTLCWPCGEDLVRRHARPAHALGRRTPGDLPLQAYARDWEAVLEPEDPDLREVLPDSNPEDRPALVRRRRVQARIASAPGRADGPACPTVPAWQQDEMSDGEFLVAGLGSQDAWVDRACWDSVVGQPDYLNAYEFAPDGTRLEGGG